MVDFSFTEEQELFRKAVREWCEKNLPLEKVREIDEKHEVPKEIIKGLADLGILLMTVPEEHGGVGADSLATSDESDFLVPAPSPLDIVSSQVAGNGHDNGRA